MREKQLLIKLNVLCYLNNYIYIVVSRKVEIEGILAFWILSPFLFLFLTSFILENKYHNERTYLKKYAYCDFGLRFLGACSAFTEFGIDFNIKITLCTILFVLNLLIEVKMVLLKPLNDRVLSITNFEEELDMNEAGGSVTLGIFLFFFCCFFFGVMMVFSLKAIYIAISLNVILYLVFCKLEYNKIFNCYKNREKGKKDYLINVTAFGIGIVLWSIQKLYFLGDIQNNIINFVIVFSLLPSVLNTRKIAICYRRYFERNNE